MRTEEPIMHETYRELVDELLDYFEVNTEEWPQVSVWSGGQFITGAVSDELYGILTAFKELRDEDEGND